jgi:hypothetical protein
VKAEASLDSCAQLTIFLEIVVTAGFFLFGCFSISCIGVQILFLLLGSGLNKGFVFCDSIARLRLPGPRAGRIEAVLRFAVRDFFLPARVFFAGASSCPRSDCTVLACRHGTSSSPVPVPLRSMPFSARAC